MVSSHIWNLSDRISFCLDIKDQSGEKPLQKSKLTTSEQPKHSTCREEAWHPTLIEWRLGTQITGFVNDW